MHPAHPTRVQPEGSPTRVHREVVSYVRRSARMTASQVAAWESWRGSWVLDVERGDTSTSIAPQPPLDLASVFGRTAPLLVEIGSGNGDSLASMAAGRPGWNVLAFEVFQPALAGTLHKLARAGAGNVRLIMGNGTQGLDHLLGPASIDELLLNFPDPWHKSRHHKRRIVDADFAALVASRLVPGGLWRLATDWEDYALWMREVLDAAPGFENVHASEGGWAPRFDERPVTKYERRGIEAGRAIFDLTYRRLEPTPSQPLP